ncbi:MAG: gerBC 1 [Firmicutes bacterium]|nr:gerBC 1 [Bacillota bacterium]
MLIRRIGAVLLVTFSLLSSGCYGSTETNDVAYVLVIGVDKADEGKQRITVQLAVPGGKSDSATSGRSEDGSAQKKPWILNTIVTPSPAEEAMLLRSTTSRLNNLTHVGIVIFSEEIARQGLAPQLAQILRSHEYRETLYLIIVPGTAEEYMKHNKPTLEEGISKFYELVFATATESGYYSPSTLHEFYSRLKNAGGSPYVAYSAVNPMTLSDKTSGAKMPQQKGDPYLSGGVPRTGTENPIEFLGLAVFREDKMVGVLNSDESRAIAILQNNFPHGYIGIVDPLKPEKDAISLNICGKSAKITASLNDSVPVFDVNVNLDGEILGITSGINYEAPGYRELLETQVANLFKEQITAMISHTQKLGTDPVGFGLYLRPQLANTSELTQTDMTALYQAAEISVTVTVKIRHTGRIWRTSPIKNQ